MIADRRTFMRDVVCKGTILFGRSERPAVRFQCNVSPMSLQMVIETQNFVSKQLRL